uniref:Hedgehog-interacting protein-like n=1 Tax=Ciona intestinalis TaxID=7719 RepID=F6TB36_CIOIN|nr:hedgehog-interacting protein-like [Ciona intestinalis]|eukprot:XP_002127824.1 hedgehog-interacting protein-like [Ciona intestinalis]
MSAMQVVVLSLLLICLLTVIVSGSKVRNRHQQRHKNRSNDVGRTNSTTPNLDRSSEEFDVTASDVRNAGSTFTKKRHRKVKRKKLNKKEARHRASESAWHYCADGKYPQEVKLSTENHGVMCGKEYPTLSCCSQHDLTMELFGARLVENIPEVNCAKLLMKLRCAHCSPRSWWLFHAPDKMTPPHKRMVPILCPKFCRQFHQACRETVAGLQMENYCDYHTTDEEGPCFPDYEVRRGTID